MVNTWRVIAGFAMVWVLMGALLLGRRHLDEWSFVLPLVLVYVAIKLAIVTTAPLIIKGSPGFIAGLRKVILLICLCAMTLLVGYLLRVNANQFH